MPESTNQPGPNQTPIYVDKNGRRRRADGDVAKFPQNGDDTSKVTDSGVAALKAELAAYKALNDARTITGGGFSGTLGSGLSWNPFGANALGPAAGGGGETGTDDNPYVMGTNSTTAGNPLVPQDDSWDLITGPSDDTGGPYDGVVLPGAVRYALDSTTTVTKVVSQDGGGTVTISTTTVRAFERRLTWNSIGALAHISAEEEVDAAAESTVTQLS